MTLSKNRHHPHLPRHAHHHRRRIAIAAAAVALGATAPVYAEEKDEAAERGKALPTVTVTSDAEESATGPVTGFVAKRGATATKTDTPLIETPQAISVITRDQIEAQGALTLREATNYTAGVVSSYFDSRVDSFSVRGGNAVQYLDGLQRTYGTYNSTKPDPYTLERVELLRGPSSVLYGQGGVGGVLNLVSKRPQAETQREVQLQYGSFNRKQIAADFTGSLDPESKWMYRLVTVNRDSGTQVDQVPDDRILIAPSLTWRPNADTSLTLQALYQKDKSGSLIGFFPWQGTLLPSLYGQIPTSTFTGEPGFDRFNSRNTSLGYLFSHRLNDTWTFRQNLRSTETKVDYFTSYTSFTANRATGRPARPVFNADARTIERDMSADINGGKMLLIDNQAEARFKTGAVEHTLLVGADFQRNTTSKLSGRGRAGALDIYAPVYGNYTPPTSFTRAPEVVQKQAGIYVQDQVKYGRWIGLLGLRHDKATTDTEGRPAAAADDKATTKRAGLVYLADGGWAPYLSYAESFLPLGGVDTSSNPFKPQRGKQWEAGVKWEPVGQRTSFMAAVYDLRDTNRKTTDPTNPLNSVQLGEVHVKGLELEYKGSIARDWDWIASYAYTDARVSRSNGSDLGKRISGVPKHTASAWVTRRFSIGGVPGFTVGGGIRYLGESWDGMDGIRTPSATLVDAMLAWDNGPLRLSLNVANLADKVQITTCLARGDCFYGQRRTVTANATYRF
ncbi:iron complex outermembrane receptor protein [Variovorax boronicumulans]|uniref:Iron complex outermembrane receptor protein n=1 Tax=Variovorax boronicumulans TaxID=436515 RepID=A0AAW8CXM4_9BURK|nr:TonB-dependent siderophore receptor [Variovorax boronicumulans]MDP9891755.1 iron complex outermembrane receptor protein [Variovorax boronicumulans]MDQ0035267.1 iron complex outermembrane receptor protein [Variovorax boronicumulans]MDQ0052928.1 iron complex outermembrane receptor protein [Variovorax boronicumulans]